MNFLMIDFLNIFNQLEAEQDKKNGRLKDCQPFLCLKLI